MKTSTSTILVSLAAAAALFSLAGCDTFQSRAREKSEVYESLPPDTQQRLQRGHIGVGDTQDMVYIALGHPDEKRTASTADGVQETWIYRSYWEQYEGTAWVGWHRVIVPAGNGRGYLIYHEPVTRDVYSTHADEVIRVAFNRGVVASVEQRRR
ncbi:MAG TPA: hypothetical protein VHD62_02030 [Opitutaceae bacterium]|nr:hypothetical protein [Opitutaceae bacterium]